MPDRLPPFPPPKSRTSTGNGLNGKHLQRFPGVNPHGLEDLMRRLRGLCFGRLAAHLAVVLPAAAILSLSLQVATAQQSYTLVKVLSGDNQASQQADINGQVHFTLTFRVNDASGNAVNVAAFNGPSESTAFGQTICAAVQVEGGTQPSVFLACQGNGAANITIGPSHEIWPATPPGPFTPQIPSHSQKWSGRRGL